MSWHAEIGLAALLSYIRFTTCSNLYCVVSTSSWRNERAWVILPHSIIYVRGIRTLHNLCYPIFEQVEILRCCQRVDEFS